MTTALPEPVPGLVVRYSFLWSKRREEGVKDRPCVVVLAVRRLGDQTIVAVAPITHSAPRDEAMAVEIPHETKRRLGLDDQQSWIVTDELNEFVWPGPDLRSIGGRVRSFSYGLIPGGLFTQVRAAIVTHLKNHALRVSRRTR